MPINHWLSMEPSAKTPIPTATFWAAAGGAVLCGQTAAFGFNLNNEDEEELLEEDDSEANSITTSSRFEHQPLFEKPLTPSDVGKLNRLVIPKQHAEKYFPLNGAAESGEKGLLLGFEDEVGKPWRFRYSYWNSSQSYVLTKGWSRFVKEKRLDAGDIVLFARHPKEVGRLFIGWRRRSGGDGGAAQPPCGGGWSGVLYPAHPFPSHQQLSSASVLHQTDCPHAEGRNGNSKRLRLFGVNLEWKEDECEASIHERSSQTVNYMFHSTDHT